jgi:hypothetical protein
MVKLTVEKQNTQRYKMPEIVLDSPIDMSVTTLIEIKKIKFQIANFSSLFLLTQPEMKKLNKTFYQNKRILKERRNKLKNKPFKYCGGCYEGYIYYGSGCSVQCDCFKDK